MAFERTRRGPLAAFVALGLVCTLVSPTALGQGVPRIGLFGQTATAKESDKARAAELFKKSVTLYRQGNFAEAIELLDEAYSLDPQPVLLYNRARAAEGLGRIDEAVAGYEKFLAEEPNAADRGAIEQRLVTLCRQRDERLALEKERSERRADSAPSSPAPEPSAAPSVPAADKAEPSHSVVPWIVTGVGVVGLAAGGAFGFLAVSKKDDAVSEPTQRAAMNLKSDADGMATASTVAFVAGGLLVAAGLTWLLVDRRVFSKKTATTSSTAWSVAGLGGVFP